MIKSKLKSIALPSMIIAIWVFGSNVLRSYSEPLALFFFSVCLIAIANMGRDRIKKNQQIPYDAGREEFLSV